MEKHRSAQRLLDRRTDDPSATARYEFTKKPDLNFAVVVDKQVEEVVHEQRKRLSR